MPVPEIYDPASFLSFPVDFIEGYWSSSVPSYDIGEENGTYRIVNPGWHGPGIDQYQNLGLLISGGALDFDAELGLTGEIDTITFTSDSSGPFATVTGASIQAESLYAILRDRVVNQDFDARLDFYALIGGLFDDIILGSGSDDVDLRGIALHLATLDLGSGDDTLSLLGDLVPGQVILGGFGRDRISTFRLDDDSPIELDLEQGIFRQSGIEFFVSGFEEVEGSQQFLRLIGTDKAEAFTTGYEDDTIRAGGGDDTIFTWGGTNILVGGDGNDTITCYGAAEVDAGAGDDVISLWVEDDVVHCGSGDDVVDASEGDDRIFGGSGNDDLSGGADRDLLNGGTGEDRMDGGENSDTYIFDALDTLTDSGTVGYDKAQINDAAGVATTMSGWSGIERVNGFTGDDSIDGSNQTSDLLLFGHDGDDQLLGGSGNDTLIGGLGDDRLEGGAGNDALIGGPGSDVLIGGDGNDVLFIGDGDDTQIDGGAGFDKVVITDAGGLTLSAGTWTGVERINGLTGNDQIDASGMNSAVTLSGAAGDDILVGGTADDRLFGGADDDRLDGDSGNDALIGAAGDDSLVGGLGNDFLLGGAGSDRFLWSTDFGRDVVKDFQDGVDRLDFSTHAGVNAIGDLVIAQSGQHTRISLAADGQDQITLADTLATSITASDFDFV